MSDREDQYIELLNVMIGKGDDISLNDLSSFDPLLVPDTKVLESTEEIQTKIANRLLIKLAKILPYASIGDCHCGNTLRYKGLPDKKLYICCTGNPEHCYPY